MALINQVMPNPTTTRNPNQQGTNTSQGEGKGHETMGSQAQVYRLTPQEAKTSNDIVTSTLIIKNLSARVLFDYGDTY